MLSAASVRIATRVHAGLPRFTRLTLCIVSGVAVCISGCTRHKIRAAKPQAPVVTGATESGIASWYGDPYHGRRSASGEIFDKEKLTAAHRTLPFETWVEVTNLDNGKKVDVRVNDRGPFVGGRIIDLSEAAAGQIQMLNAGIAKVRLRVIDPPDEQTVAASHTQMRTPQSAKPAVLARSQPQREPVRSSAVSSNVPSAVTAQTNVSADDGGDETTDVRQDAIQRTQPLTKAPAPTPGAIPADAISASSFSTVQSSTVVPPAPPRDLTYAVEAGTFPDRGSAEARSVLLSKTLGESRVVASSKNPQLWEVLVGRDLTLRQAVALATRLQEEMGQPSNVILEPAPARYPDTP